MIPKTLLCKTSIRGIAMITNNGKSTIKPNRNLWRKWLYKDNIFIQHIVMVKIKIFCQILGVSTASPN